MFLLIVFDNLKKIISRIEAAAERAGRDPGNIKLIAVTKYASSDEIKALLDVGLLSEIAENKVQDAGRKKIALSKKARWHLVGHLQSNKAKQALQIFDTLDSLDSLKLASTLEKDLAALQNEMPALVQVKLSDKEAQSGIPPAGVGDFLSAMQAYPHLKVQGLMAIAPVTEPVEAVRPYFREMRGLFDRFFAGRPEARLSMGMSRDFEIAVEEGATEVRIGSLIFN